MSGNGGRGSGGRPRSRQTVNPSREGGYDCEFVHPPPDYLQTECSVCLMVLRNAHISTCCGHNFCKDCIHRVREEGSSCPLCSGKGFTVAYNRAYDVTLRQLEVHCTHRTSGCEWTGKLESLEKHLNVDPKREEQLEGCDMVEVQCCHDGCGQLFQRRLIAKHQVQDCPKRLYSCEHCQEYESTYDDVAHHWTVCSCYPVICPHNCTVETIQRQHLEEHVTSECPLQVVECDFKYIGCPAKLPRKSMQEHLKDSTSHISLLTQQNQELTARLIEKEEQVKKLFEQKEKEVKKIREEMQRETKRMIEEKQRELRREMIEEQKMKIDKLSKEHQRKIEGFKRERDQVHGLVQKLAQRIESLEKQNVLVGPVHLTMPRFTQHKRDDAAWCSDAFYTHPQGYKMSLKVHANGYEVGKGTHVSCYIYLHRGEFDHQLKWPFRGVAIISLLNQREDGGHHIHTVPFNDDTPQDCCVIKGKVSALGWGYHHKFFPHDELTYDPGTNCQFLTNDCLYFRIQVKVDT